MIEVKKNVLIHARVLSQTYEIGNWFVKWMSYAHDICVLLSPRAYVLCNLKERNRMMVLSICFVVFTLVGIVKFAKGRRKKMHCMNEAKT